MKKIKKHKRMSAMLLCALMLQGGCGFHTTEEIERVDTTKEIESVNTTENFDLMGISGRKETVSLWGMDSHRCQKRGYMG